MNKTQTEYYTKEIAAAKLNLSPRRVLELGAEGQIRVVEAYNPDTKRRQKALSAEDVDRLAGERQPSTALVAARPAFPPQAAAPSDDGAAGPEPACAWLTLDQAGHYTGLPATFLAALIRSAALRALDVGVREGGRYRVKRSDLDAISGGLLSV